MGNKEGAYRGLGNPHTSTRPQWVWNVTEGYTQIEQVGTTPCDPPTHAPLHEGGAQPVVIFQAPLYTNIH